MSYRARGKSFQVDVQVLRNGKEKRERFSVKTEAEAHAEDAQASLMFAKNQEYLKPKDRKSLEHTECDDKKVRNVNEIYQLGFLYKVTLRDVWSKSKSESSSIKNSRYVLEFFGQDRDYRTIQGSEIDEFCEAMAECGNSGGTINRKTATLSRMLRTAREKGWSNTQPYIRRQPEGQHRIRYLTKDEESVVLSYHKEAGEPFYSDLWLVLLDTGFRVSEALKIDLGKDLNGDLLTCWENKSSNPRTIPLSKRLQELFKGYQSKGITKPFADIPQRKVNDKWDRMRISMGLYDDKQFVPHCLRHTCATRLVNAGNELVLVQQWLGHKTISVTQKYAHLLPSALLKARDRMEELEGSNTVHLKL